MTTIRVGTAQVAPRFFDKAGTLKKTIDVIDEAGRLGLDLLVFPETYFAAYPYWRGSVSVRRSTELVVEMQRSAIRVPGDETEALAAAARRARVNCVIGCNELDDRPGSLTLYNTLVFLGRDGRLLGRHRKLMPTHSERVYWGMGDASDIRAFDMDIGRVGGLICYEHHMTLLRAAMAIKGEEIHCAVWPGWWAVERHLGAKRPEPGSRACDIEPAIREYAIENQVFVVSSSWYLPSGEIPP
ncbi:MAG: carbon-nitrogen hydrolase family protein, partial [Candidatus Rokubacteria bacterium]|nr:carbon-nitrogen hydrolase family protein [Candidatus Rokubacteria bacterium]